MMLIRFFLLFPLVAIAVGTLQSSGNPNEKFIWVQQGGNIDGLAEGDLALNPSLSADGLTVAVAGKNHDGPNGENSGVNRVFKLVNNVWVQQGSNIDGLAEGDQAWGPSLSADGLTIAVAGRKHDGPNGEDSGVTRVFKEMPLKCMWDTNCVIGQCEAGSHCEVFQWWSQCQEDTDLPATDCISTQNGHGSTAHWGCLSDADCCNSAATCIDGHCLLPCLAEV